ncbi:hypothetical protein D3C83_203630 [compost metagenome]
MAPMNPAETPSLNPEKMTGEAAGMMILRMTSRSLARNDVAISLIDAGVLRTAPLVLRTMTGIAMMQTTKTFEVRPMP